MSLRSLAAVATAAAIAAATWLALRPPDLPPLESLPGDGSVATAKPAVTAASAPQKVASGAKSAAPAGQAAPAKSARAPSLFDELVHVKQYRILYDRLAQSSEGETPEGRLVMYEILRQCATIPDWPRRQQRYTPPRRETFMEGIPATDPQRDRRIAAYDQLAEQCKGFEGMTVRNADLTKLVADAAAAGNPYARALLIDQEQAQMLRTGSVTLTEAQLDSLRQVLGSRDPEAIRVAARVLGNAWLGNSIGIGAEHVPIEQRAFVNAFLLLSCEFGAACGSDTPRMLEACASRGHCDARDYPEYVQHYGSTAHDLQLIGQYREIVRNAIITGDWSQITLVRGSAAPNQRITFVPGPR